MDNIYVHNLSVDCAVLRDCSVCLHRLLKLIPPDVLPYDKLCLPANKRPETCPRFQTILRSKFCGLYEESSKILTVGDGDFSFSLSLVNGGHHVDKILATSYESYDSVTNVYTNSNSILQQLSEVGVSVLHDIDATNITIPKTLKFDIIIWNFPCIGIERGADGQTEHILKNQELLRKFFGNASNYLKRNGKCEIHLTHKTIEPFSWWNIIDIGTSCNYSFLGSLLFDRCLYPGYINRKALDRKSFPSTDAQWNGNNNNNNDNSNTEVSNANNAAPTSTLNENPNLSTYQSRLTDICDYVVKNYMKIDDDYTGPVSVKHTSSYTTSDNNNNNNNKRSSVSLMKNNESQLNQKVSKKK